MTAREATVQRLYELLPRVYRVRDEQSNRQLRQLIEVVADQIDVLEESLDQFYDDQFIETCADWVVPYLGDLIGYRPLNDEATRISSPRAEVANTIAYRRRKGTAAMLEQLAFDVTGWKARAVEFFEYLAVNQYMNHPRLGKGGTAELRHQWRLERVGTAFDDFAHTAEVRRISTGTGRYNIHNVGLFLWRVAALELTGVPLVPDAESDDDRRFRFHPLGIDQPIFGKPRVEEEITHIAEPFDVPLPLTRRWLSKHQEAYYGPGRSLSVELLGDVTPATVHICDLSDVANDWAHAPEPGVIAIDPVLGRVYFPSPVSGQVRAIGNFNYGAALDIGGGGYGRKVTVVDGPVRSVSAGTALQAKMNQVTGGGTVEIEDSWHYPTGAGLTIAAAASKTVLLRAADRQRPLLVGTGKVKLVPAAGGTVVLDGLLISGGPVVLEATGDDEIRKVILRHCTLVPGLTRTTDNEPVSPDKASLIVSHPFAQVEIERCVLGLIVAVGGATVSIADSVVDASGASGIGYSEKENGVEAGGALTLDRCTVIGRVYAAEVDISNSIVLGQVEASRRQTGCVRYSFVPDDSLAPPKYRCQPAGTAARPQFTSLRFGDPGYAQLRPSTVDVIRSGADNDSEMGAGNYLFAPQREANLRLRLDEYLRFGLEAGIFYAT